MVLVINTLEDNSWNKQIASLLDSKDNQIKIIDTNELEIHHCLGCNVCWLKTPGQCVIKDDYKSIIKQLVTAEGLWLISDTRYGFLNYRGKRIMNRIMPMLQIAGLFLKLVVNKKFEQFAQDLGCYEPLDAKPYAHI